MTLAYRAATSLVKGAIRILCRVDDSQTSRVPPHGSLIIAANHINFLEVPLIYTHLQPRPLTGFAKAETWSNPLLRPLAELWGGIPLHRGEADAAAFRRALEALEAGRIVAVAPEGTRSGDGRLQRGRPGIITLALRSHAPILPLAHYGGEQFWHNLRHLRRTEFRIVVGEPFVLDLGGAQATRALRQAMADCIMQRIADLLPPAYRGVYAETTGQTCPHLRPWTPPSA